MRTLLSFLTSDVPWVAVSAIVSAGVAYATFRLARYTKDLAVETKDLAKASLSQFEQAEIHHRQSLSPMVTATMFCNVVASNVDGTSVFVMRGKAINAGPGSATFVKLVVLPLAIDQEFTVEASPIMSPNSESSFELAFDLKGRYEWLDRVPYRVAVRYSDIFGDEGWTVLESISGSEKDIVTVQSVFPSSHLSIKGRKSRDTFEMVVRGLRTQIRFALEDQGKLRGQ